MAITGISSSWTNFNLRFTLHRANKKGQSGFTLIALKHSIINTWLWLLKKWFRFNIAKRGEGKREKMPKCATWAMSNEVHLFYFPVKIPHCRLWDHIYIHTGFAFTDRIEDIQCDADSSTVIHFTWPVNMKYWKILSQILSSLCPIW